MSYFLLFIGLVILVYSGQFLIKASVAIAGRYKVSKLVIGLTIVAFGTSAPELFVSVMAAVKGHPEIAVGNVVGSNIANITLILGFTALLSLIKVNRDTIRFDWPVMMGISLLFYLLIADGYLTLPEGVIMLIILVVYLVIIIRYSVKNHISLPVEEPTRLSMPLAIFIIFLAAAGLSLGSYLLVDNASQIATRLGISERIISITIIAFGTSVPELATSVIATLRKELDISVGNLIGSNIFNLAAVMGITSLVEPIEISPFTRSFDIYWMLGSALLIVLLMLPVKNSRLGWPKGALLLGVYALYIYLLVTTTNL